MEDIFAAVDARPKRRQGVTGQTIEAQMRGTMCQITEYELDMLRDEIARLKAAFELVSNQRDKYAKEIARLKAERDTALAQLAAAFEVAAKAAWESAMAHEGVSRWTVEDLADQVAGKVRALTPADASAALSRMLDEADAAGQERMREAAAIDVDAWFYDPASDEEDTTLSDAIRALPITPRPDREDRT